MLSAQPSCADLANPTILAKGTVTAAAKHILSTSPKWREEQQIKAVLHSVYVFWDLKVSWICILNERRGDPEPKKQEKGLEKVSTNRLHKKQTIVFGVCRHLELFVSSCSWEVPCVVKALKRENVLKPRDICWRKFFVWFVCLQCLLTLKSGEKLYYFCKSSVLHTSKDAISLPRFYHSRTEEKPFLSTAETPLGIWGKWGMDFT